MAKSCPMRSHLVEQSSCVTWQLADEKSAVQFGRNVENVQKGRDFKGTLCRAVIPRYKMTLKSYLYLGS
jgi:hypothetical protein